jgi:hypothetical protein
MFSIWKFSWLSKQKRVYQDCTSVAFRDEHSSRQCGDRSGSSLRTERRLARRRITGVLLDRMKLKLQSRQSAIGEGCLRIGCVEDDDHMFILAVVPAIRVELHHDDPRRLVGARVQEAQILLDFFER